MALAGDAVDSELFSGVHLRLDLREDLQREIWWTGSGFEHPTPAVVRDWATTGTHFFDVGANFGFYSLLVASAEPTVEIHAFEPTPDLASGLREVVKRNGLARLHVHELGLSDVADHLELHTGRDSSGHSTFGPHPELLDRPGVMATVCTFDEWAASEGLVLPDRPSWVCKIDVEGYEPRVLRGMTGALAARAFAGIVVELNEWTLEFCGSSREEVRSILSAHGYSERNPPHAGVHFNAFFAPT